MQDFFSAIFCHELSTYLSYDCLIFLPRSAPRGAGGYWRQMKGTPRLLLCAIPVNVGKDRAPKAARGKNRGGHGRYSNPPVDCLWKRRAGLWDEKNRY